jgi:hypothetical protein
MRSKKKPKARLHCYTRYLDGLVPGDFIYVEVDGRRSYFLVDTVSRAGRLGRHTAVTEEYVHSFRLA